MRSTSFERLAGLRVMFGHQSVGRNIMDGVRDVLSTQSFDGWPVIETAEARPSTTGGFFAHGPIGRNGDPVSKTREFCEMVAGRPGGSVDVALHKYCYVDIGSATDVDVLFASYRDAMRRVRAICPSVTFVHVTVPLVRVRTGSGAWLQARLGRTSPRIADNARREDFNDHLRREYNGHEPVFDLAALESNATGGRSLRADYTDDGGHLNAAGRRRVAGELLAMLADLPRTR